MLRVGMYFEKLCVGLHRDRMFFQSSFTNIFSAPFAVNNKNALLQTEGKHIAPVGARKSKDLF